MVWFFSIGMTFFVVVYRVSQKKPYFCVLAKNFQKCFFFKNRMKMHPYRWFLKKNFGATSALILPLNVVSNRKILCFEIFSKMNLLGVILCEGIDCAHFLSMKNELDPDSGNGVDVRAKKEKISIFASIHQLHSLNQGQGSIFMFHESAQSIPHINYSYMCHFW